MEQVELFQAKSADEVFSSVLRLWPNDVAARQFFAENNVDELVKKELRVFWMEAWFIDISVVCSPNPGRMGIGIFARSSSRGNFRYAEFAGDGNAAIAAQIATERASELMVAKNMELVVLRANAKFLESKLGAPKDADKEMMPLASSLFSESGTHKFIWMQDGEFGMKTAKLMAAEVLNT